MKMENEINLYWALGTADKFIEYTEGKCQETWIKERKKIVKEIKERRKMSQDYEQEIGYQVNLIVDGEIVGEIEGYSYEDIGEQWHKLDHRLEEYNQEQEAFGIAMYESLLEDELIESEEK